MGGRVGIYLYPGCGDGGGAGMGMGGRVEVGGGLKVPGRYGDGMERRG